MTPTTAAIIIGSALSAHATIAEDGVEYLNSWCAARAGKLASPEAAGLVAALIDRISGAKWITGLAQDRPDGLLDEVGVLAIEAALQSGTPLCTEDLPTEENP